MSKADLVRFAQRIKFHGKLDSKDSRERTEKRIANFVTNNKSCRTALFSLVSNESSEQTEGWLEVIRQN